MNEEGICNSTRTKRNIKRLIDRKNKQPRIIKNRKKKKRVREYVSKKFQNLDQPS